MKEKKMTMRERIMQGKLFTDVLGHRVSFPLQRKSLLCL